MADYFEEARQTDTTMTVTAADTTPETTALAAPSTEGPTIMAYPPGVSLATITIGAGRTMFGAAPKLISATVTPIFVGTPHVVHAASRWAFYPSPQTFRVENGEELSFELPHVNAEGWRDTAGNEFPALLPSGERDRGWAYHAKFTVIGGSGQDAIPHRYEKVFQPLVGQTEPLDLDLVPDGRIGAPVSAPMAVVSSIAGLTGPVTADQLQALGLGGLGEEDVAALADAAAEQAVVDAGTYTDLKVGDVRSEVTQAGYLTEVSVEQTAPGTYRVGASGTVYGLTVGQLLPAAAKDDLASELTTAETVIGAAVAAAADDGVARARPVLDAAYPSRVPGVLNLRERGASGTRTDVANSVFAAAMVEAKESRRAVWTGLINDPPGTRTIHLPAGDYRITDLNGLMGKEGMTTKGRGIRFVGAGSDLTHVHFVPAAAGPLITNTLWNNVGFEGITFTTGTAGSTFMHNISDANAAVQEFTFTDVKWLGPWKYCFNLQGGNNNSEYRFFGCGTNQLAADGAFLYIGTENTSDQFLNFWFYGFKHWSTLAPLIDAAKGGHFHLHGVDVSAWGGSLTQKQYVINLRGNSHGQGVQTFTATGLRVEGKNNLAGLLYSEWDNGNVSIQADFSSQTPFYTYEDIIHLNLNNVAGPVYNFHDSHLAGGVRVQWNTETWRNAPKINFTNCMWRQRLTPSEVVSYSAPATNNYATGFKPQVEFIGCRGVNQDVSATGGASVWDATIGFAGGSMVSPIQRRQIVLRGNKGIMSNTDTVRANLPVGAYITGIRAISPTTISSDTDGASWTVATSEATPTTIATATVTGALNAGYDQAATLTVPFHCDTRGKATIVAKATGNPFSRPEAFLVVEGYW